jgi:hypothetical protein
MLLAFRRDRHSWTWRITALAVAPYVAGFAAYGIYIMQDPQSFWRQMSGNVSGLAGEASGMTRFGGLKQPLTALRREVLDRYLSTFMGGSWRDPYRPQLLILLLYFGGAMVACIDRGIRR